MKTTILTLFLMSAASVTSFAACPNLTGDFTCSNGSPLKISQKSTSSNTTEYLVQGLLNGDLNMVTDGSPHLIDGATITSSCKNNVLQARMDHDRGSLDFSFSIQNKALKVSSTVQGDMTCH